MTGKHISLTDYEISLITTLAKHAELGGISHIRNKNRKETLASDQLTAQLGEASLSKFLTGSIKLYLETRIEKNKNPWEGDKGTDLIGYPFDVKTSRARRGPDFNYHLWIRDPEYHQQTIYILALVPDINHSPVHLVGWKPGKEIKQKEGNRWTVPRNNLYPITLLPREKLKNLPIHNL